MTNKIIRDDVTITYAEVIPEDRQMAEFYVYQEAPKTYATLEYKDRVLHLDRNGEMHITIPSDPWQGYDYSYNEQNIRYTDDLELYAKTDKELMDLIQLWSVEREYEIYHMNPWWELWNDDVFPDGMVCDEDFYEAVDMAIDVIKNDEAWN
jgi:hypothetical protein